MVHAVAQLIEALRCKSEGHEFDSHGVTGMFLSQNLSGRTMAVGFDSL
jgi:hypothetical protein